MTERLGEINDRISGIRQLGAVVNAIRGIAAARAQQARGQLAAVDRYAAMIASAIGQALAMAPPAREPARRRSARAGLVLFCAEQGFAGAFSKRVIDAVAADLAHADLFLVGARGNQALAEVGATAGWTGAMPSHSPGIPKLADGIVQALTAHIASGRIETLDAVYTSFEPGKSATIERKTLFPFDTAAFPLPGGNAPLLNLDPAALLRALAKDYMHAQLCEAALHAFAAENEARMEAMAGARRQIASELETLQALQRRVRQEEITAEIIELAAGEAASRRPARRKVALSTFRV